MAKLVVCLSGSISAGKSTLSEGLHSSFGVSILKTKSILKDLAEKKGHALEAERRSMQEFGERLDRQTDGAWVRDALAKFVRNLPDDAVVLVDAVRIPEQISAIRRANFRVKHIHLKASPSVLEQRYTLRSRPDFKELRSYSQAEKNKTEARVIKLEKIADIVIDTELCTERDVLVRAATHLGFYPKDYGRVVDVVVGGQFGSEGKGHIVSYISRDYNVLVRVGGPNAGHKVFVEGQPYTHHQLPSGTRFSQARLVISAGSVLNAEALLKEIAECKVDAERLSIDPQAMIISKRDIEREGGLASKIASTRQGVGYATARRIVDRDKPAPLAKDVPDLKPFVRDTWEVLEAAYSKGHKVLIEGTQGTGLSVYHGWYPYVTSRDTTVAGALSEAGVSPSRVRKVIMVCRAYPIRVQSPKDATSGPMIGREITWDIVAKRARLDGTLLRNTEKTSTTNKDRRVAEFSWELLRKASVLNAPTDIALTFADYLCGENANARRFEQLDSGTIMFIEEVERVAAAPVSLISTRFDYRSIIDRRAW